ncbi:(3S,6E)-nerolidol synthase 1 isoform X1 [Arachis duranensis]|uniref:(3S,6E)-nerolidol synthase 1 isoform X1 n=1 Tax=Arachis duranensis TaxID=130453 RepID=A0A6P5NB16_ARADU|nr:(3S,6E)-nerolidol synthase 1 isoform X1 [Arachis duranensis]
MAISYSSFGFSNQISFSPNKPKHDCWSRCLSKTHFTMVFNQTINNLPENLNLKFQESVKVRHGEVVEKVKRALMMSSAEECLSMVDSIQRLGIEHHFEDEIAATLENKYLQTHRRSNEYDHRQKLSRVALEFRLLRQQGYYAHTDVFDEYHNTKGELKHTLLYEDIDELIALFEASQLRIPGEYFLDEAEDFSRQYLWSIASRFHDHPQAKSIQHTLRFPIHRTLPRFIPQTLQLLGNAPWTTSLQQLSQIDTQLVNSLHLKEILQVSKWWKDLGLAKELKFVRDEPIKWYMWPMACLSGPRFSQERVDLTKPLSLIYIVDDIFDCYGGSIHELTLFTHAVERWDLAAMEELPNCMKVCFKTLYEVTNEFALKTYVKHGLNPISTLVKSWVKLFNAFLEEAKWFASGNLPSAEEYLKIGRVSTGVHVILVHAFFSMGQGLTNRNVTLMNEFPTIISTLSTILRLCDDLEGDKESNKDDTRDGSYIKCYIKDHSGISIEETRKHVSNRISEEWKRLNQELLAPENQLPSSFVRMCFNGARMVPLMYSYDGDSPSKLEEHVKSLIYNGANLQPTPPQDHATVVA